MALTANTSQKHSQFNVQQFQTASFKLCGLLKALTNKQFQVDRVTVGAASLTY